MSHPAVAQLRRAVQLALRDREKELAEILERERRHPWRPGKPDFAALLWMDFAGRAHDLASFAPAAPRVSPESAETALAVLEAFCEAGDRGGWSVADKPEGRMLVATSGDLRAEVTVRERFQPGNMQRQIGEGVRLVQAKKGSGVLVLLVEGLGRTALKIEGTPQQLQQLSRDGLLFKRMRQRSENARAYAAASQAQRREDENRAADAACQHQAEQRQREAATVEAARRDQLLRDALAWEQAETIRRYVARAAVAGADPAWCAWALAVATAIDPLAGR